MSEREKERGRRMKERKEGCPGSRLGTRGRLGEGSSLSRLKTGCTGAYNPHTSREQIGEFAWEQEERGESPEKIKEDEEFL